MKAIVGARAMEAFGLVFLGLVACIQHGRVHAAPGDLDTSFNGTGYQLYPASPTAPYTATRLLVQPDGKLVGVLGGSAGQRSVIRLNGDGTLDGGFGAGGVASSPGLQVLDVALAPGGKIAGIANYGTPMVYRFNADGSLDATFGSGGAASGNNVGYGGSWSVIGVQSDGKVVVGGIAISSYAQAYSYPCGTYQYQCGSYRCGCHWLYGCDYCPIWCTANRYCTGYNYTYQYAIALGRFNADGSFDTTFGSNGYVFSSFTGGSGVTDLLIQADDSIVVAGTQNGSPLLLKFSRNGASAGSAGLPGFTQVAKVAADARGNLVVAGQGNLSGQNHMAVARLSASLSLDAAFRGGVVQHAVGSSSQGGGVTVQPSGQVVVAGRRDQGAFVARFNADGSVDSGFGTGGVAVVTVGSAGSNAMDVVIDAEGQIVIAGVHIPASGNSQALFAALRSDMAPEPPKASGDAHTTAENAPLTIPAPGVLGNDTDANGDPLTARLVSPPAHGTVTLNANGSFTYAPTEYYSGPDRFTYVANDGTADSNVATVSITVTPVNQAPAAAANSYTVGEGKVLNVVAPGVLANDTDQDGDRLEAALVTPPAHGSLDLRPDGSFVYTPQPGYNGPDGFAYRATDPAGAASQAAVSITVQPKARPVVSLTAPASAAFGTRFTVGAGSNASTTAVVTVDPGSGSVCSISGMEVTMLSGSGSCTLNASWAADDDYYAATAQAVTAAAKAQPAVTFTGAPAVAAYRSAFSVASTTNGSSPPVYSASGACSNAGTAYAMTTGTGACTATVNWAADGNYLAATLTQTTQAAKLDPEVSATGNSCVYDGNGCAGAGSAKGAAGEALPVRLIYRSGSAEIAGAPVNAGSYTVTAEFTGNAEYNARQSNPAPVVISKASQANVVVNAPASAAYAQAGVMASASGGSGTGAYAFSASGSTACTVDPASGAVTIARGTGTCSITAMRAEDTNYNASAPSAAVSIAITKAVPTVTLTGAPGSATYRSSFAVSSTTDSSATPTYAASGACSNAGTTYTMTTGTGTCTATVSWPADDNYQAATLTRETAAARLDPEVVAQGNTCTYDGNPCAGSGSAKGAAGEALPVRLVYRAGASDLGGAPVSAGSYLVVAEFAGNADYNPRQSAPAPITINKANQGAVGVSLPASAVFAQAGIVAAASGGNGTGAYSFSAAGSSACTIDPASGAVAITRGTGTCTITAMRAADGNYNASAPSSPVSMGISRAASAVAIMAADATYDGAAHGATALASGNGGLAQPVAVTYSGTGGTAYGPAANAPVDAGSYLASASFGGSADHLPSSASQPFVIAKAPSAVTLANTSALYDGEPHFATALVSGVGDGVTQSLQWSYAGAASTGPVNAGSYAVTATYGGDRNHLPASVTGTLVIQPAAASIEYTGANLAMTSATSGNEAAMLSSASLAAAAGDLSTARVTFVSEQHPQGIPGCVALPARILSARTATAACAWTANVGAAAALSTKVSAVLDEGNYVSVRDGITVDVQRPAKAYNAAANATAKALATAVGPYAGEEATIHAAVASPRGNGAGLVGTMKASIPHGNAAFAVEATTLRGLAVGSGSATLIGTATIGSTPAGSASASPIVSGALFELRMTDNGEPGAGKDTVSLTVWSADGTLLLSTKWNGRRTLPALIHTGNVAVN